MQLFYMHTRNNAIKKYDGLVQSCHVGTEMHTVYTQTITIIMQVL